MKRPRETEQSASGQDLTQLGESTLNIPTSLAIDPRTFLSPRSRTSSPASSSTPANDGPSPTAKEKEQKRQPTPSPEDEPRSKIIELDFSSETADGKKDDGDSMKCSLPGHKYPQTFGTYDEYEAHYIRSHSNRCRQCRKNFPSEHLLGLHIEELHDSFVAVKRERGEQTYACFVEGCDRRCSTASKRNRHLIDKHMYPKNYFFDVTRDGIDGRMSMLKEGPYREHRRHQKPRAQNSAENAVDSAEKAGQTSEAAPAEAALANGDKIELDPVDDKATKEPEPADVEMNDLSKAMSSLRFVPSAIRFGRGRKGFSRH
ncbi:zinc finger domain containing protein [Rhypophila decipiens]